MIEKYLEEWQLDKMPKKQALIFQTIYKTYKGVGKDDLMLSTAMNVYKRLYNIICNLDSDKQLKIIHESTIIAYDARCETFDHIINLYNNDKNEIKD